MQDYLIDTHVHLEELDDVQRAIGDAMAAGIHRIVAVGMNHSSNQRILELSETYPEVVRPAIGYHPLKILSEEVDETVAFIEARLDDCIALGEVGLDYKVKVKKPLQKAVFVRLLKSAQSNGKPVIVHSRYSYMRTHQMVADSGIEKAVFHWYSGPLDILDRILSDGYHVSATPALAYSRHHQACMRHAPIERILIETDAPETYKGIPSVPRDLLTTLNLLSRLKGLPVSRVARVTTDNARAFYGI